MKKVWPLILVGAVAIAVWVGVAAIVRADRVEQAEPVTTGKRRTVIAKLRNEVSGEVTLVYAIEKEHRFPNGKVGEAWLMEPAHLAGHGDPVWFARPKRAEKVEWVNR